MERRNFMRGMLASGATVATAPTVALAAGAPALASGGDSAYMAGLLQ